MPADVGMKHYQVDFIPQALFKVIDSIFEVIPIPQVEFDAGELRCVLDSESCIPVCLGDKNVDIVQALIELFIWLVEMLCLVAEDAGSA